MNFLMPFLVMTMAFTDPTGFIDGVDEYSIDMELQAGVDVAEWVRLYAGVDSIVYGTDMKVVPFTPRYNAGLEIGHRFVKVGYRHDFHHVIDINGGDIMSAPDMDSIYIKLEVNNGNIKN
jgi:hypothetical protein